MNENAAEGILFSIRPAAPSPIVGSGGPELFLLSVFFVPVDSGSGPYVKLEGICAQVTKVYVTLRLNDVALDTPIVIHPNAGDGRWRIRQPLSGTNGLLTIGIQDDTGAARDYAAVHLPPHLAPVPAGSLLNLSDNGPACGVE